MRYTKYLKFYISCVIILGTLSSILSFPYKEEKNFEVEVEKIKIEENLVNGNVDIIDGKDNRYSIQSNKNEENAKNSSLEKEKKLSLKVLFNFCFALLWLVVLYYLDFY